MRKFERELRQKFGEEWDLEMTAGNHYRLVHRETGMICYTASTTSDWRSTRNIRSQIKRMLRQKPH